MNILERTTTEEYDEDGRLTSRTTVEKMDGGPVLPIVEKDGKETAAKLADKHAELIAALDDEEYRNLTTYMMTRYKCKWPACYKEALLCAEAWTWAGD